MNTFHELCHFPRMEIMRLRYRVNVIHSTLDILMKCDGFLPFQQRKVVQMVLVVLLNSNKFTAITKSQKFILSSLVAHNILLQAKRIPRPHIQIITSCFIHLLKHWDEYIDSPRNDEERFWELIDEDDNLKDYVWHQLSVLRSFKGAYPCVLTRKVHVLCRMKEEDFYQKIQRKFHFCSPKMYFCLRSNLENL